MIAALHLSPAAQVADRAQLQFDGDATPAPHAELVFADSAARIGVFPSIEMDAKAAALHGVIRGSNFATVIVSINPKTVSDRVIGIAPQVLHASATNLLGQKRSVDFKEIREGDALYYLGSVQAIEAEFMRIEIKIGLAGEETQRAVLRYQHAVWE